MKIFYTTLIICLALSLQAQNNCNGFNLFPEGIEEGKKTHVLYVDYMRQDPPNYEAAFPLWKRIYEHSPSGHVRHFTDGVKIYKNLIKLEADPSKKAQLIKTLWSIYDHRIECMGKEGYVLGRKAYNMYFLREDTEATLNTFKRAIALTENETADYVLSTYAKVYVNAFIKNSESKNSADIDVYREVQTQLEAIAQHNIDSPRKDGHKEKYTQALETIQVQFKKLDDHYLDCAHYLELHRHEFDERRFNTQNLKNLSKEDRQIWLATYRKLEANRCPKSNTFMQKIQDFDTRWLAEQKKPKAPAKPKSPLELIEYYEQQITETKDSDKQASLNLRIAEVLYVKQKQAPKAREYALKAAALKSNWGAPYILIGEMYAASSKTCNTDLDGRAVVWAAIDKWEYAKSIDPEVATEANRLIARYTAYMPGVEICHMKNLKAGAPYKVKCWIQETSRIRVGK